MTYYQKKEVNAVTKRVVASGTYQRAGEGARPVQVAGQ